MGDVCYKPSDSQSLQQHPRGYMLSAGYVFSTHHVVIYIAKGSLCRPTVHVLFCTGLNCEVHYLVLCSQLLSKRNGGQVLSVVHLQSVLQFLCQQYISVQQSLSSQARAIMRMLYAVSHTARGTGAQLSHRLWYRGRVIEVSTLKVCCGSLSNISFSDYATIAGLVRGDPRCLSAAVVGGEG